MAAAGSRISHPGRKSTLDAATDSSFPTYGAAFLRTWAFRHLEQSFAATVRNRIGKLRATHCVANRMPRLCLQVPSEPIRLQA